MKFIGKVSSSSRRTFLQSGIATASIFLPAPVAWVWAQSEGAAKLLRAPKQALVIGNSSYKTSPLKNPANDARAIGAALKSAGFDVTTQLDAPYAELAQAVRAYTQLLAQRQAVGLFYFAGHGLQLAWRNYMVPVDANVRTATDIQSQCVELGDLLAGIAKARNPLNVIILDACRDNPFGGLAGVDQKGLSQMDAPPSTLLAYATAPGNVASDGDGANGLYTEHLLKEISVPDAKVEDVFKRVRLHVRRRTNGQARSRTLVCGGSGDLGEDQDINHARAARRLFAALPQRALLGTGAVPVGSRAGARGREKGRGGNTGRQPVYQGHGACRYQLQGG